MQNSVLPNESYSLVGPRLLPPAELQPPGGMGFAQ